MSPLSDANIIICWITLYGEKRVGKYFGTNEPGMNKRKRKKKLNKMFRWNEVILSVQIRTLFRYRKSIS